MGRSFTSFVVAAMLWPVEAADELSARFSPPDVRPPVRISAHVAEPAKANAKGTASDVQPARRWVPIAPKQTPPPEAQETRGTGLPERLSQTGLFSVGDGARQVIDPSHLRFAPQYPLWSDGAVKRRWLHLPEGSRIDGSDPDVWKFPVGTKFWKEFRFGDRVVETRLIQRFEDGWRAGAYVWNAEGTDARLAPEGLKDAHAITADVSHDVPSMADCRSCHEAIPSFILGFSALQLSPDRDPGAPNAERRGEDFVDLRVIADRGLLAGFPPQRLEPPPRVIAGSDVERRALGYLHANCGNCHNGRGPLSRLGLNLWQDVSVPKRVVAPAVRTTIGKQGDWRLPGEERDAVRVVPGVPERSSVFVRMASREPLVQMPPLATQRVDREGVAAVSAWIRELAKQDERRER